MRTTEKAYAKINLYLDVLAKREDGFHDIKTVMHAVSLADELSLSVTPSSETSVILKIIGDDAIPTDDRNLVVKAAKAFSLKTEIKFEAEIALTKQIPSSAGLAGGSSDAAATLRALNRIFEFPLSQDELLELAAALGSDVPFCLVGGTALCEGRGEVLTPITVDKKMHFVIAKGSSAVSTPRAYSRLDELHSDFANYDISSAEKRYEIFSDSLHGGNVAASLYNIFEEAVSTQAPEVARLKSLLLNECGAKAAIMSGSGPAVFAIFDSEDKSVFAASRLNSMNMTAYAVTTA